MPIIKFYHKLITSKFLAAYSTPGLLGVVMKLETGVGLILLAFLLLFTIISLPASLWLALFFFASFLFITLLLHSDRMTLIFLGIPYLMLLLMRVLDNFIKPKAVDDDLIDFYKMLKMVLTFVLWPFVLMLAVFVWFFFISSIIDLIADLLDKLING